MPDANGVFHPVEMETINKKLAELWKNNPVSCPVTHDSNWFVNELMMAPLAANQTGIIYGAPQFYACVAVICRTCGYTMFFRAQTLGIYFPPPQVPIPTTPPSYPPPIVPSALGRPLQNWLKGSPGGQ